MLSVLHLRSAGCSKVMKTLFSTAALSAHPSCMGLLSVWNPLLRPTRGRGQGQGVLSIPRCPVWLSTLYRRGRWLSPPCATTAWRNQPVGVRPFLGPTQLRRSGSSGFVSLARALLRCPRTLVLSPDGWSRRLLAVLPPRSRLSALHTAESRHPTTLRLRTRGLPCLCQCPFASAPVSAVPSAVVTRASSEGLSLSAAVTSSQARGHCPPGNAGQPVGRRAGHCILPSLGARSQTWDMCLVGSGPVPDPR